jgi:MoxR-like ATPase
MGYPTMTEEIVILDEQKRKHPIDELEEVLPVAELRELQAAVREVYVDPSVAEYIVRLVNVTRTHPDVYLGASPRGSIALYRAGQARAALLGRDFVIPDDVKVLAVPALAHRLIIKTSSSIREVDASAVVKEILEGVPVDTPSGRPTGPRRVDAEASRGR